MAGNTILQLRSFAGRTRPNAVTFTLGDSMSVINEPTRRVYNLRQMVELFAKGDLVAGFGLSDRIGFQ